MTAATETETETQTVDLSTVAEIGAEMTTANLPHAKQASATTTIPSANPAASNANPPLQNPMLYPLGVRNACASLRLNGLGSLIPTRALFPVAWERKM